MQPTRVNSNRFCIATCLVSLLLLSLPASIASAQAPAEPILGRLLTPEGARVVARHEKCLCEPLSPDTADVFLVTVGTEIEGPEKTHFHPVAMLAFDHSLHEGQRGQWVALWTFGPSPAGWRRNLRALTPLPVGAPSTSEGKLEELRERLEEITQDSEEGDLLVPDPVVHLDNLGRFPRSRGIWGGVRRGLSWAGVFNPAQWIFRTYQHRRKDRRERDFQRAYLALQWLLDLEFSQGVDAAWVDTLVDLRFHLLRNRSFFGPWLQHADASELVFNYESDVRVQLGKTSSWLQSAANEHYLRYQPIYRYTENGARFPLGGVLYYDPRLAGQPEAGWWSTANPFDLPYNPHRHPEVQRLAQEHPDELIPLAVYTFQTNLALRPIIAIDFFAPANPRTRESTHELMILAKQWLALTTGSLSLERIPYRLIAWAANKKGYTLLVDKSSRLGIEELRLSLESHLYFEPELRRALLERADQRVLNPLIKPGPVQELVAHIQYESLRAEQDKAICHEVVEIRRAMTEKLKVPEGLSPEDRRAQLSSRLVAWRHQVRLQDFLSQPLEDFGSLGSLLTPLRYFLLNEPIDKEELSDLLVGLYARLYRQQLRLPAGRSVPELDQTLGLVRQVWRRQEPDDATLEKHVREVEHATRLEHQKELRRQEQEQREVLRRFMDQSLKELERAAQADCAQRQASAVELEARLWILLEIARAVQEGNHLQPQWERRLPRLRQGLTSLQEALGSCPPDTRDPWLEESRQSCRQLARALERALSEPPSPARAGGK